MKDNWKERKWQWERQRENQMERDTDNDIKEERMK